MSETEVASVYLGLHVSAQDLTGQITKAAQDATKQTTNIFSGLGKKIGGAAWYGSSNKIYQRLH